MLPHCCGIIIPADGGRRDRGVQRCHQYAAAAATKALQVPRVKPEAMSAASPPRAKPRPQAPETDSKGSGGGGDGGGS